MLRRSGMVFEVSFSRSMKNLKKKDLVGEAAKWYGRFYTLSDKGRALLLKASSKLGYRYISQMLNDLEEGEVLNVLKEMVKTNGL